MLQLSLLFSSWWVMNQRAQYAHRNQGKKTWLTDERIQLLNDIGFIWTPHQKQKQKDGGKTKKAAKSKREDSSSEEDGKKKDSSESTPKKKKAKKESNRETTDV